MTEITPEKIRAVLDVELGGNDSGEPTVRRYLLRLLRDVWTDGEGFNGKRPFGNSGWDYDVKVPMIKAGLVKGTLDSDGYVASLDDAAADELILAAIAALDAPRESAPQEPGKVITVTEASGRERGYRADEGDDHTDYGRLRIVRDGRKVAGYNAEAWLSWREDGAEVPVDDDHSTEEQNAGLYEDWAASQ